MFEMNQTDPRTDGRQHAYAKWDAADWKAAQAFAVAEMWNAILTLGHELAIAHGLLSDQVELDGEIIAAPSYGDIVRALQLPMPAAQVVAWLMQGSDVELPPVLLQAVATAVTPA